MNNRFPHRDTLSEALTDAYQLSVGSNSSAVVYQDRRTFVAFLLGEGSPLGATLLCITSVTPEARRLALNLPVIPS
jgi:hypothetical protein